MNVYIYIIVFIALVATLYGIYNVMFFHEGNKEDFLIYNNAKSRGFTNV